VAAAGRIASTESELRPGRPEAAAAIWDWRGASAPRGSAGPSATQIRLRGFLQGLVALAVGAGLLAWGFRGFGIAACVFGSVVGLSALLSPTGLHAGLLRLFAATGRVIGRALTWTLLPVIFFGFFFVFGSLFRRGRRDSMKRFYDPGAPSYWSKRSPGRAGSQSRERQY
jgi:hypothetical protein